MDAPTAPSVGIFPQVPPSRGASPLSLMPGTGLNLSLVVVSPRVCERSLSLPRFPTVAVPGTWAGPGADFQLSGNSSSRFCARLSVQRGENKAERKQPSVLGWSCSHQGKPQPGQTLCKGTESSEGNK